MTALEKYTRLEALGQWREAPDQDAREVVVSFGNSTLLLSDLNESPLCHWAMAATSRISLDGSRAVYTPDTEGFETLIIDDAEMVEAIAKVALAVSVKPVKTHWIHWTFLTIVAAALIFTAQSIPSLLRDQAFRMTGPDSARKLGVDMVSTLNIDICREPRADAAVQIFLTRAFPDANILLLVTNSSDHAGAYPGNVILIDDGSVRNSPAPEDLAALVAALSAQNDQALGRLFQAASLRQLLGYITTGTLDKSLITTTAQNLVQAASAIDSRRNIQPPLRDQDWVALQGICLEYI